MDHTDDILILHVSFLIIEIKWSSTYALSTEKTCSDSVYVNVYSLRPHTGLRYFVMITHYDNM